MELSHSASFEGDNSTPSGVNNNSEEHVAIKLFVGRLPTNKTEDEIRPIFETFGKVSEVVVIRDKATRTHKGSAFVRMESIRAADAAIRKLSSADNNTNLGALQISYAVGEAERLGFEPGSLVPGEDEAKVFIGSLPRDVTEYEIISFFSSYGACHDPFLMKDMEKRRFKGCGFLKFEQKEDALLAIRALHGKVKFPRATRVLELRIAKPKRSSTPQGNSLNNVYNQSTSVSSSGRGDTHHSNYPGGGGAGGGGLMNSFMRASSPYSQHQRHQQQQHHYQQQQQHHNSYNNNSAQQHQRLYNNQRLSIQQQSMPTNNKAFNLSGGGNNASTSSPNYMMSQSSAVTISQLNANPRTVGHWKEYFTMHGRPYYYNTQTFRTQWELPPEFSHGVNNNSNNNSVHMNNSNNNNHMKHEANSASESTGPSGANIFVFHVPNEWTRKDLIANFSRFGQIVSATIAIDHTTQKNKGFGFVSYTNIGSALQAIQEMNMLCVGNKRLRVAIKNGEIEDAQQYAKQHKIPFPKGGGNIGNNMSNSNYNYNNNNPNRYNNSSSQQRQQQPQQNNEVTSSMFSHGNNMASDSIGEHTKRSTCNIMNKQPSQQQQPSIYSSSNGMYMTSNVSVPQQRLFNNSSMTNNNAMNKQSQQQQTMMSDKKSHGPGFSQVAEDNSINSNSTAPTSSGVQQTNALQQGSTFTNTFRYGTFPFPYNHQSDKTYLVSQQQSLPHHIEN